MFDKFNTQEYDEKVVLTNGERSCTFKELKKLVYAEILRLKNIGSKNIVLLGEDNFKFIIHFLAGLFTKKTLFLVTDAKKMKDLETNYYIMDELADSDNEIGEFPEIEPKETIINFLTSGSTSKPKLIEKNLFNLIEEAKDAAAEFEYFENENLTFISTTKLSHLFGLTFHFMVPFYNGFVIKTDTINYPEQINVDDSFLVSTPSFLEKICKYKVDVPKAPRWIFSSGAKLDDETFAYIEKKSNIVEIYGSTETGVVAYRRTSNARSFKKFRNVRICQNEDGQIIVSSNYFPQGEMVQGDIIEMEGDNSFILKGRADRVLKIQEKRVGAVELEQKLNENEYVESSFCLKIEDKIGAVVVLNSSGKKYFLEKGSLEFIKHLKAHLKNVSEIIPQKWRFLPEIPKNTAGKIDLKKMEEIFQINLTHPLVLSQSSFKDTAELEMAFHDSSNFFQGHFKKYPIVPGVVQMFFAQRFANECLKTDLPLKQVKKVKFSNIIKPNQIVKLSLVKKENSLSYKYFNEEKIFSSGIFDNSKG